jgi:hypothetical protein
MTVDSLAQYVSPNFACFFLPLEWFISMSWDLKYSGETIEMLLVADV